MDNEHACEYRERMEALELENAKLETEIEEYKTKLEKLETEFEEYKKPPKDSSNSSIPPSQDQNRYHYPKREKSGKKTGGQSGHPGHRHPLSDNPDEVVECPVPEQCPYCGSTELDRLDVPLPVSQVVDVPEVKPHVTEYRQQQARCRHCKKVVKGTLPAGVSGPVQMGERAKALTTYFKAAHALSDGRVVELFEDVLGLKVSKGWVENILSKKAKSFLPTYEQIRTQIVASPVVGSDETGVRINGKKAYTWIVQNTQNLVYFKTAFSRGFKVLEEILGTSRKGTHVSDRYGAQLKLQVDFNQLCLIHIIRECRYLIQHYNGPFATQLKSVLTKVMDFREIQGENYQPQQHQETIREFEEQLNQCFAHAPPEEKRAARLHKHLRVRKDKLLRFLYDPMVPTTNNDSERPLRHTKLLQKVFGGFRTLPGIQRYDVFLSIIQSAKRQKLNILDVLSGKLQLDLT